METKYRLTAIFIIMTCFTVCLNANTNDDDSGAEFTFVEKYYYVDDNAPNDPSPMIPGVNVGEPGLSDPNEDGSLQHPYDSIQKAINEANDHNSIAVLDGTYMGVGNYNIDPSGKSVTIKSQNDPYNCWIFPEFEGRAFIFQNGEDANTVIDGFAILGGYSTQSGGAIYCNGSSPTIKNCEFIFNYADWSGGAIYLTNGSNAHISLCSLFINDCEGNGAGICSIESSPIIEKCFIGYNWCYQGECGGGIYCDGGTPQIEDCSIIGNYADWAGGGISVENNCDAKIRRCAISYNECGTSGGGICSNASAADTNNCVIADNYGYFSGGAASIYDSNMTFANCTIADNYSENEHIGTGGIFLGEGDTIVKNSILWGNSGQTEKQICRYREYESIIVTYCDIQHSDNNDVWFDITNMDTDPLFADANSHNYFLQSQAGRWLPTMYAPGDFNYDGIINTYDLEVFSMYWLAEGPSLPADFNRDDIVNFIDYAILAENWEIPVENMGEWLYSDLATSPCIDAGDPTSDYSLEPDPNGGRINMGAFGNTKYASGSPE